MGNTASLELNSDLSEINSVESFVEKIVNSYQVSDEIYGNMLISITEAVSNAIMHGNKADRSKKVRILLEKTKKKLAFRITDEGAGFDHNELPDPTSPENIPKIGGRGVFLMKQLADMVVFDDNGSTVEIQFKI